MPKKVTKSKVSIIVPIYNVEPYLARCLDSLTAQTLKEIEIVCVDDGSTDNSFKILQQYAQKDNRIIALQQENHGVEWARAEAIEHASSDYIMFCDPDDWYEPQMCEKMVQTMSEQDVDIVMCDLNIVGMEDKDMERYYNRMPKPGKYEKPIQFFRKVALSLWRSIFKKKLLNDSKLFFPKDEHIRRGYDTSFIIQYLMCAQHIYFLPDKLYNYWQWEGSLVHSFNSGKSINKFDIWYGLEYLLKFMKHHNFYEKYKCNIFSWINSRFFYLFSKLSDEGKENALKIIFNIFKPYKKDISGSEYWLYLVVHKKFHRVLNELFNFKEIKFLGIPVYKRYRKEKNKKIFLFGIPVLEKIKENGKKEIYLFKCRIYKKKENS